MTSISGQEAVNLVAGVVGVTLLLAGVIAVLFSQLRKNTTQIVRDENADLRERLVTVEGQVVAAEKREENCKERLTDLETTSRHLADMLTGASAVADLATLVAFHHDEQAAALRRVLDKLDSLEQNLGA